MDFAWLILASAFLVSLCTGQDEPLPFTLETGDAAQRLIEGTSGVFPCRASPDASGKHPTLAWFQDDVEITKTVLTPGDDTEPYVTSNKFGDQVQLGLIFGKVTVEDSSILKCVASLDGREAESSVKLEVLSLLKVLSLPDQFGYFQEDGKLECKFTGTPTQQWLFKNGTEIVSNEKYVIDGDFLTIKKLTFEDAGFYICALVDWTQNQRKTLTIDYEVVDKPKIPSPPTIQPNNPKVGDDVRITCVAEGTPKPTFTFKNGENVVQGQEDINVDEVNGVLTLKSITIDSEAQYTCVASNRGGTAESQTTLDVMVPPKMTAAFEPSQSVSETEALDVKCTAEGDPAPSLLWYKVEGTENIRFPLPSGEGPEIVDEPSTEPDDAPQKTASQILRFSSVRPSDVGDYLCKAQNSAGSVNQSMTLNVLFAPHFDTDFKQTEFYGWKGHRANLTCMASANRLASFKWYMDASEPGDVTTAKQIQTGSIYTIEDTQEFPEYHLSSSSLFVDLSHETESALYKDYICEASNGQTATRTVTLKRATAPGVPTLSVLNTRSTSVVLEVAKPTENGGQPVNKYLYKYYETPDNAKEGTLEGADIKDDTTTFEINELQPSTDYVIEIQAGNIVDISVAQTVQFKTDEVSKPAKLDITSPAMGLEPSSYTLKWAQPEDGGSPITKFIITYQQALVGGESPAEWEVESYATESSQIKRTIENEPDTIEYRITGLKSSTYYEVRIVAENALGASELERRIIKTSPGAQTPAEDVWEEKEGYEDKLQGSEKDGQAKSSTNKVSNVRDSSPGQLACNLATLLVLLATASLATLVRC